MFKNLIVFSVSPAWKQSPEALEDVLLNHRFFECGPTQDKSVGWIAPRADEQGPLLEVIGQQWMLKLMIETKAVPGNLVRRKADERAARIEEKEGRKPGRQEMKELREDTRLSLLPQAFTKRSTVWVWIDRKAKRLCLDAASDSKADEVIVALNKAMEGLGLERTDTKTSPASSMSTWLVEQQAPEGFTLDRDTELKAADDTKAVVRYSKHALDIEEVKLHVTGGKLPTKLALTWHSRVSFVLTELFQIKRIQFLEGVFETDRTQNEAERFDTDITITTAELGRMIPDLLEAMGGESTA